MNDHKIEGSDGRGFGRQQLLAHSIGNCISDKKKSFVTARYLQSIKTFLIVELSQYSKRGSTFSSSEQVEERSDCSSLGNVLSLCLPVRPAQALCARALP